MRPQRRLVISTQSSLDIPGYQQLHSSSTMNSYLKVYTNVKQASTSKCKLHIWKVCPANELLKAAIDTTVYIDQLTMKKALESRFVHLGDAVLEGKHITISDLEIESIEVNYETLRTRAFVKRISQHLEKHKHQFSIEPIRLPKRLRKAYSEYGQSINDCCIIHRTSYKGSTQVAAGVITGLNSTQPFEDGKETIKEGKKTNDRLFEGVFTSVGVIEFKRVKYDTEQTIKEMLKASGDLIAKVLIEGNKVDRAIVYGLAANYQNKNAILVVLLLDFVNCKSYTFMSSEPVNMCDALNWQLSCICI